MSLLPDGLQLVKDELEPLPVRICQADTAGPWFVVSVNPIPVDKFKRLLQKANPPSNVRAGSKAANDFQSKFERTYCKVIIQGWSGLTISNFEHLLAGAEVVSGDDLDDWRESGKEIPYSLDLAVYLYQNSWAEKFSNPVFTAVQDRATEDQEEEEEKNEF